MEVRPSRVAGQPAAAATSRVVAAAMPRVWAGLAGLWAIARWNSPRARSITIRQATEAAPEDW